MPTLTLDLDWTPGPIRVEYAVEWSDDGHTPHVIIGAVRHLKANIRSFLSAATLADLEEWCLEDERHRAEERHAERHYHACRRTDAGQYKE